MSTLFKQHECEFLLGAASVDGQHSDPTTFYWIHISNQSQSFPNDFLKLLIHPKDPSPPKKLQRCFFLDFIKILIHTHARSSTSGQGVCVCVCVWYLPYHSFACWVLNEVSVQFLHTGRDG